MVDPKDLEEGEDPQEAGEEPAGAGEEQKPEEGTTEETKETEPEKPKEPQEPDESETAPEGEASKTVTEQVTDFQERKDKADEAIAEAKKESKPPKPSSRADVTHMNAFRDKLVKELELEAVDKDKEVSIIMPNVKGIVCKLLVRANCWYGIARDDPNQGNKWKAFRVLNAEDEATHYDYIKTFVETNKGD